jgi:hypothetical protein
MKPLSVNKGIQFTLLISIFFQSSYAQFDSDLYEQQVIQKINVERLKNNLDTLIYNPLVKQCATSECEFQSQFSTGADDPDFCKKLSELVGMDVYSSYNGLITDFWDLNVLQLTEGIEEVLASEVVRKFYTDKRQDVMLKSLKKDYPNSTAYIGISTKFYKTQLFSCVVFYITKSSPNP